MKTHTKTSETLTFPTCDLEVITIGGVFSHANVNWHNRNLVNYSIDTSKETADFIGRNLLDLADVSQSYSL